MQSADRVLSTREVNAAAKDLDAAEQARAPIRMMTARHPDLTIADAYAIQQAWLAIKLKRGRRLIGHKIGLTSRAMQQAVGIDEPDSGFLLDDMLFADGSDVPTDRFIGLRIEAELAFLLKSRLEGPHVTMYDVLNATDIVTPALEILDVRVHRVDPETKRSRSVRDTIADNAANAGLVLGGRPFRPMDHDMRWIGAIVSRNGKVEETGLAAGVLNNPANGIAWLARRMAEQGGALEPGQIVLAGSFIRPIEVASGDSIVADYGPFGTVSCRFA